MGVMNPLPTLTVTSVLTQFPLQSLWVEIGEIWRVLYSSWSHHFKSYKKNNSLHSSIFQPSTINLFNISQEVPTLENIALGVRVQTETTQMKSVHKSSACLCPMSEAHFPGLRSKCNEGKKWDSGWSAILNRGLIHFDITFKVLIKGKGKRETHSNWATQVVLHEVLHINLEQSLLNFDSQNAWKCFANPKKIWNQYFLLKI